MTTTFRLTCNFSFTYLRHRIVWFSLFTLSLHAVKVVWGREINATFASDNLNASKSSQLRILSEVPKSRDLWRILEEDLPQTKLSSVFVWSCSSARRRFEVNVFCLHLLDFVMKYSYTLSLSFSLSSGCLWLEFFILRALCESSASAYSVFNHLAPRAPYRDITCKNE